jgi:large subunit ribosomal protein L35
MKQKTHRGAAKRLRVTRTGKVLARKANRNHFLGKKSSSRKRRLAKMNEVTAERKVALRLLGRR